jgi:hypothetical protein
MALGPSTGLAQVSIPDQDTRSDNSDNGGFAKPYEYERQAYGYDPEGVEYKENQAEDFQVVFISSLPFTALASFGITGLASLATRGSFSVGDDYFLPFVIGTGAASTTIACVSVLTNKYPPPGSSTVVETLPGPKALAFNLPLVTLKF